MSVVIKAALYAIGVISLLVVFLQFVFFSAPRLTCDSTEHNFGVVPIDGTVSHTFILNNTGGRPLHISKIQSNCVCAKANVSKSVLKPGEHADLIVELSLKNKQGIVPGRVLIESNDPASPQMLFSVIAIPPQKLMVSPPLIDMGSLRYGQLGDKTMELEILCREPKLLSFHVEDIVFPSLIHTRLRNLEGPGRPRLQVWLDEGAPIGPLTGMIRLEEGSEPRARVELSVRGAVTGPVLADPDMAYFGLVKPGTTASKRIAIKSTGEHRCPVRTQVESISNNLKQFIRATVMESDEATYLNIQLRPDSIEPGAFSEVKGVVRLRCKAADGPKVYVRIPVHFFLER